MLHVSHYGARLFEERRRWTNLTFTRFRFATLNSYYTLLLLLQTGAGSISYSMYFYRWKFFSSNIIAMYMLYNTLIGAAILKSSHPYIIGLLPRAHNSVWDTWCCVYIFFYHFQLHKTTISYSFVVYSFLIAAFILLMDSSKPCMHWRWRLHLNHHNSRPCLLIAVTMCPSRYLVGIVMYIAFPNLQVGIRSNPMAFDWQTKYITTSIACTCTMAMQGHHN